MKILLNLIFLLSLIAIPKSVLAETLPHVLQKTIQNAENLCERSGEGKFSFDPKYIRKIDLNNDRKTDYILWEQGFECSTYASLYSGSAGYSIDIFISGQNGDYSREGVVAYSYKVNSQTSPPEIVFNGRCFLDGTKVGEAVWQWQNGKFVLKSSNMDCPKE